MPCWTRSVSLGAEVRYQRVLDRRGIGGRWPSAGRPATSAEFLSRDDTVVARMAAAVDVVEAAGLEVDPVDEPHVRPHICRRAVRWQRYSRRGPVSDLHRACGADIVRGSLRLWSQGSAGESS